MSGCHCGCAHSRWDNLFTIGINDWSGCGCYRMLVVDDGMVDDKAIHITNTR